MRKLTYSNILMAPLFMLLAVACSPNQFNQSTEYDDVYFTSADRTGVATPVRSERARAAQIESQEKTAVLENYSTDQLDEQIVNKYNNGQDHVVTYFEEGPIVKRAADLNYDDFVADYNNQQLAHYELPLDWETDWNRVSFNSLMNRDFDFRLAWYDQYYRGQNFRMTQYLNGSFAGVGRRGILGGPTVGLAVGFSNVHLGFANAAFIDLNPWGFYDPFWTPIRGWGWNRGWGVGWGWNRGWGFNVWNRGFGWGGGWGWNAPFWCPPVGGFGWGGWGWRGGWRNNVFVNNNIIIDRRAERILAGNGAIQDVRRGPRVSTNRVSTVRNEAVNGTAPTTRSSRYVDNLSGNRSGELRSRSGRANTGRATTTNSVVSGRSTRSTITNGRANRTRTSAYRFEDSGRSSRSSTVRNYGSSSRSNYDSRTRATTSSRSGVRSSSGRTGSTVNSSSRTQSNPSFSRGSSSRSYSSGRTSGSYGNNAYRGNSSRSSSRSAYSRGSSSRNSYSRGSSSRSYSNNRSSSRSRSSGSFSRGSSSRSSGSRSFSRGSSSRSSRSSGSFSRGSSSRSSGSRSSSSRSGSSRSGRSN